jgi:hypothetical protein
VRSSSSSGDPHIWVPRFTGAIIRKKAIKMRQKRPYEGSIYSMSMLKAVTQHLQLLFGVSSVMTSYDSLVIDCIYDGSSQ